MKGWRGGKPSLTCDTCHADLTGRKKLTTTGDGAAKRHFCNKDCKSDYTKPKRTKCPNCKELVATGEPTCWNCKLPLVNEDERVKIHGQ